jgi:hypothetical protein
MYVYLTYCTYVCISISVYVLKSMSRGPVAYAYNPNYTRGRDQEDHGS